MSSPSSSSPPIKKRKNISQTSEPIYPKQIVDTTHVRDKQIEKIIRGTKAVFNNVRNLRQQDFGKIIKNCYLKPIRINEKLETPEKDNNPQTSFQSPLRKLSPSVASPSRSFQSPAAAQTISSNSSLPNGKAFYAYINKLQFYPKCLIQLNQPYLFYGQNGSRNAKTGYLQAIVAICHRNHDDVQVQDLIFRVKELQYVDPHQYMKKQNEDDDDDEEEQQCKTPPQSPHNPPSHHSASQSIVFDEEGNPISILRNNQNLIDLSLKNLYLQNQQLLPAKLCFHSTLEKLKQKTRSTTYLENLNHCVLVSNDDAIQFAVELTMERILGGVELEHQRQNCQRIINHNCKNLIDYCNSVWAEGGYKDKKKKDIKQQQQQHAMKVKKMKQRQVLIKKKQNSTGINVEQMVVKQHQLEYNEMYQSQQGDFDNDEDEEEKFRVQSDDSWSDGFSQNEDDDDNAQRAEREDETPCQEFKYQTIKAEKPQDIEYKQMFQLSSNKKKIIDIKAIYDDEQENIENAKKKRQSKSHNLTQKKRNLITLKNQQLYKKCIQVSLLNFIPADMGCRDLQTGQINSFLYSALNQSASGSLYISGMPGTGKTALVLKCINQLKRQHKNSFKFIQINAMNLSKPNVMYKILYDNIIKKGKIRNQEASAKLESYFRGKPSNHPKNPHYILLLDELDAIVNKKQDVLYNIFNWPKYDYAGFSVIAVANTMDLPQKFQPKIASRMGKMRVVFEPYSKQQMMLILEARVGKFQLFEKDALRFLATRVAQQSGDFRRVLHTARQSLEMCRDLYRDQVEADEKTATQIVKVKVKHVLQAYNFLYGVKLHRSLKDISPIQKLLLVALLWRAREKSRTHNQNGNQRYAEDSSMRIDLNHIINQLQIIINRVNDRVVDLLPDEEVRQNLIQIWYHKNEKDFSKMDEVQLVKNLNQVSKIIAKKLIVTFGFIFNEKIRNVFLLSKYQLIKEFIQMENRRFVKVLATQRFYEVELQIFKSELFEAMTKDPIFEEFKNEIGMTQDY